MNRAASKIFAIYLVCGVLIAMSAAVIMAKWPRAPRKPVAKSFSSRGVSQEILALALPTDQGTVVRLGSLPSRYVLLYLFTPQDCAACLPELAELSGFQQRQSDLRILAVMSYANPDEARQTHENFGLRFPIVQDPQAKLLAAVAPPKTPWKLVLRLPEGDVVLEAASTADQADSQAFLRKLEALGKS